MNARSAIASLLATATFTMAASAFEFRARFVERVGSVDTVLVDNTVIALDGGARRVRFQIGVFDDASGPAPAGGILGWNVGQIAVDGTDSNSAERRTPGRLAPFTFANAPNANGNPPAAGGLSMGDAIGTDFQGWTEIDATLGTQSPFWGFDGSGNPLPQPAPTIRGRNTFVSIYEITVDPAAGALNYLIHFSGNLLAASEWRTVGSPVPPDPMSMTPGQVTYAPLALPPESIDISLFVHTTPSPSGGVLLCLAGFIGRRRR